MSNQRVGVELDPKTGKLRVTCPFHANDLIMDLDGKNWSKAQRAWLVPITRANAALIIGKLGSFCDISDEARRAMKNTSPPVWKGGGIGFPAWYKFKTDPRKHQRMALKRYGIKTLALFMIMRAGKTKVVIDMASALRMENKIDAVLVVTKLSTRRTWREQFGLHCPIPHRVFLPYVDEGRAFDQFVHQVRGIRVEEGVLHTGNEYSFPIMVVGTESLSQGGMFKMCEVLLSQGKRVLMVIDESSMIASHKAERSRRCVELGRRAEYRFALTGTPTSEGPMNLFMQFEFLDTNIIGLGDFHAFRNRYAVMGGYRVEIRPGVRKPMQIVGYQNLEELTKLIAPYTVEVGEDQLDLPPKVYEKRYVQLTAKQRDLYDTIRKEGAYKWKGEEVVVKNVLELELRLHQVCGGYTATRAKDEKGREITTHHAVVEAGANPKIAELIDLIEELGSKKQGIIWCAYRAEIADCVAALKAMHGGALIVEEIHGGISEEQRENTRVAFQRGVVRWVVANAATGSMGLDMSAASAEIFYSNTNKMIDRTQAEMRAMADGKKTSVLIVDILAEKTVDELRMQAIEQKQDLSEYIRARLKDAIAAIRGEF